MLPALAEDLHEQVRTAVDYLRLLSEFRYGVDHTEDLYHAADAVQRTHRIFDRRQQHQPDLARVLIGDFGRHVPADLARGYRTIGAPRPLPSKQEQVSRPHLVHLPADRPRQTGQRQPPFAALSFWRGRRHLSASAASLRGIP